MIDGRWDGIKGYLTYTKLMDNQVMENYKNFWQIEKAFCIFNPNYAIEKRLLLR